MQGISFKMPHSTATRSILPSTVSALLAVFALFFSKTAFSRCTSSLWISSRQRLPNSGST